jgi:Na+/H+-dicarboxylate symporter
MSTPLVYLVMLVLGVCAGFSDISFLKSLGLLISDIFIRIFKCISLPIISLSIIVTLANYCSKGALKTVWRRTMIYTLGTTFLAAALSCGLYLLISPDSISGALYHTTSKVATHSTSYVEYISHLIPSTIFSPFLENQVISVLFLGIVIGVAIRFIPDEEPRETITHFFRGAHGLFMVITRWVIAIIPIGLFGFITATVVQFRAGTEVHGLGQYLLVIVLANVIQGLVVLPIWLKTKNIAPYTMMKKMMPALSLAFFSKSSVGTLPMTMDTVETQLGVRPNISRFVLPLCTSINMNGCAAFIFTTVVYLMQNHGLHLSLSSMLMWVVIATVAAIGNAGVPMGCFFLSTSLLASMNIPIELMGVILPFYSVIDMLETALNVWSDACVVKVVDDEMTEPTAQPELLVNPT